MPPIASSSHLPTITRTSPGGLGFQADNEIAGEAGGCASCACAAADNVRAATVASQAKTTTLAAWQAHLQAAYPSLDAVNAAWGTVCWSHTYESWAEVPLPWNTLGGSHSPSLALDSRRFRNSVAVGYLQRQGAPRCAVAPVRPWQGADVQLHGHVPESGLPGLWRLAGPDGVGQLVLEVPNVVRVAARTAILVADAGTRVHAWRQRQRAEHTDHGAASWADGPGGALWCGGRPLCCVCLRTRASPTVPMASPSSGEDAQDGG